MKSIYEPNLTANSQDGNENNNQVPYSRLNSNL